MPFAGTSGVGKSSLINRLYGEAVRSDALEVREEDGKGRHTTTWRELILLPGGGLVIDGACGSSISGWPMAVWRRPSQCPTRPPMPFPRLFPPPGCAAPNCRRDAFSPDRFAAFRKLRQELDYLARDQITPMPSGDGTGEGSAAQRHGSDPSGWGRPPPRLIPFRGVPTGPGSSRQARPLRLKACPSEWKSKLAVLLFLSGALAMRGAEIHQVNGIAALVGESVITYEQVEIPLPARSISNAPVATRRPPAGGAPGARLHINPWFNDA